ncbi:MAG: hypothetical protein BGN97_10070 [Microbacterium sp. 69-10]|uniref:hypothetical protein n=1 Tax=Microbacterium sp. 69-10 TaxID=1895783 RepID=UPI0009693CF2|nr:hypothetical protein [Microbacterium sp. 69-10]OJU41508.1 MAG: hypothetical protein BGN97_10070 [Microbacterium sp. 69-10]
MHEQHHTPKPGHDGRGFEDSERLRELLTRLDQAGQSAWRSDPEAAGLMRHAAQKYAALAKKHGLDPWEAASAAFVAMQGPSARRANDPWAVVTHAVRITCIAEERGQGLLCSVNRARRPHYSAFHDAERFSDRENELPEYHPAFQTPGPDDLDDEEEPSSAVEACTGVESAIADTIALFCYLGWPAGTAHAGIEYICTRLAECPNRVSAFESLRRDYQARALLDIPGTSWLAMLRAVLGNPDPDQTHTNTGRGVLLRLLIDEPLRVLLTDDRLLAEVAQAAPGRSGRGHRG